MGKLLRLPEFGSGQFVWVIRTGVSLNNVTGSGVDDTKDNWSKSKWDGDFKNSLGGTISFGFQKSFTKIPLYWGAELGIGMRGYKSEAEWKYSNKSSISGGYDSHTKESKEKLNAFNTQLSPSIGYQYKLGNNMAIDAHIGGFVSYDMFGKLKNELADHVYISSKYGTTNKKDKDSNETKISDIDKYQNFDAGLNVGIGFWYGHFNIDFSWKRGFIKILDTDSDLYSNNIILRLGYAF